MMSGMIDYIYRHQVCSSVYDRYFSITIVGIFRPPSHPHPLPARIGVSPQLRGYTEDNFSRIPTRYVRCAPLVFFARAIQRLLPSFALLVESSIHTLLNATRVSAIRCPVVNFFRTGEEKSLGRIRGLTQSTLYC